MVLLVLTTPGLAQDPYPGETLISPLNSEASFLVDLDGAVTHTWHGADGPTAIAFLLPDSSILRPCKDPAGQFPHGGAG
jgi:hypothetical protein